MRYGVSPRGFFLQKFDKFSFALRLDFAWAGCIISGVFFGGGQVEGTAAQRNF